MNQMKRHIFPQVAGIIALMLSWEVLSIWRTDLIPHLTSVASAVVALLQESSTHKDILWTLRRIAIAFIAAVGLGIPLGILIGSSRRLRLSFTGPIDFMRSLPAFVLLPAFLVLFSGGETARIAMAAFGAGIVILANTILGVAHIRQTRIEVARLYGASKAFILMGVVGPQVLPQAGDGCLVGLSLTTILVIVSEIMLGATFGLGTRVNDSLASFELPRMYALIAIIGGLGYGMNLIARIVVGRMSRHGRHL